MFSESSTLSATSTDGLVSDALPRQTPKEGRLTDALARKYMVRVMAHAKRLARRLPAHLALSDLLSAGLLGVVEGFARYDASRPGTLDAYIDHCIRGALLDELRREDPLTRVQRTFARKVARAAHAATGAGAPSCDTSLATALGVSVSVLREKMAQVATATALRDTETTREVDDLHGEDSTPEEALDARQRQSLLLQAVATLPAREREVLALYYAEGRTLSEIGVAFGVTESRMSQLHARAIERLRAAVSA